MAQSDEPTAQESPVAVASDQADVAPDAAATASATPDPQPPRRLDRLKLTARARRRTLIIIGSLVALAVIVLLGMVGYRMFSSQVGAAKKLDAAAVLIEEADVIVVEVDAVVRSDVTTGLADTANAAIQRVPEAEWQLKDALGLIGDAQKRGRARDRQRAELLDAAATARLEMLAQGPAILALNAKASDALPPARAGWEALLTADKTSDEAVAAYNRLTKAGVKQSSKLNKRAEGELAEARRQFVLAESAFPEAGFDLYIAYLDTRISMNQLSQQSDAAWLENNTAQANDIIARYNALDQTGIAQAKGLPASPEAAIADAYEKAAQAATIAYYNARDAATAADEALR